MDTGIDSETISEAPSATSTLSVGRTVIVFAFAFAMVDLAIGVVPVNLMLRHFMAGQMPSVWLVSVMRLVFRMLVSAAACAVTLRAAGRVGGPLTSTTPRGIMSLGAITSGAVAGAIDVGVHRLLVWPMIHLAQRSSIAAEIISALLTAVVAGAIVVIMLVPRTRVVDSASPPDTDALQPA